MGIEFDTGSALVVGVGGIVIAWLAYRAGVRSHESTVRVEAQTLSDAAKRMLDELGDERASLLTWYEHFYAAQGRFYSGAMDVKRREFDGFAETIEGQKADLAATEGIDRMVGRRLEKTLVDVRSIHERTSGIKDKFSQYRRDLREDAAEHRTQALQALRAKQDP